MKEKLLILCILCSIFFTVSAQEKLVITADRSIYIGGEDIWFTVMNLDGESNRFSDLSKVAYIELLNAANVPVIQEKVYFHNGTATSQISIPDSVSTGNYLLRAYTKWMTNFSADTYEHVIISIVNPFANNSLPAFKADTISEKSTEQKSLTSSVVKGLQKNYKNRQQVALSIDLQEKDWQHLNVSIIKSCLYHPVDRLKSESHYLKEIEEESIKIPEHRGEIIKGRITNIQSGLPIVNEKMMLSFVGQNPVLKFSVTDSTGGFLFEVNRFGEQEMVIQPYSSDTTKLNYKVTLEDAYSGKYSESKLPDLVLDSATVKEINSAIVNMQIKTIYSAHRPNIATADSIEKMEAFYGEPENTVLIGRYIDLPTTEEVIREIVPSVFLRKSDGEYYVKVYEDKSMYPREGKTMTFVDGVPVNDFKRILNISPEYLERIEVLNLNYYYGDENLGRLLLFFTQDNDMGNMEFDHRIFRQAYKGYLYNYQYRNPDYSREEGMKSRLADYRNLLYYASYSDLDDTKQVDFEFTTGDDVSDYTIIMTGINEKGQKETVSESFRVE
ncbi:hypothetical protein KDU71_14620 [Carboxylicivirga sediminis]|uniref:Macroglobulin domain-containing protein n=1 Tax=Carboxylicivirga sediminis TaxID=2006564 RepID=A0A941IYA1_9BACT|nr:hypothetical protein [Carboxylicivirga sediminis]MBR8536805.1 hypothetical protein [Carboxylicivirga sediminis]